MSRPLLPFAPSLLLYKIDPLTPGRRLSSSQATALERHDGGTVQHGVRLKALNFDPVSASAPLVATLVDVSGIAIYSALPFCS